MPWTASHGPVRRTALIAVCALAAVLLGGCTGTSTATGPVKTVRDVLFRSVDGHDLRLDACVPAGADRLPMVVLVHGGGFTNGRPSDLDFLCTATAQRGFAVFSVDYRLLPAPYPAQLQDVAAAIDWLRRPAQVARFGSDPDRIGLVGASAGATIVAQLATRTPGAPARPGHLDAVVLLSGVYGPIPLDAASAQIAAGYLGCNLSTAACAARARDLYAVDRVTTDDPPTLVVNSTDELAPLPQAEQFVAALAAQDVSHELLVVPGTAHAEGVLVTDPDAQTRLLGFLDRHLR